MSSPRIHPLLSRSVEIPSASDVNMLYFYLNRTPKNNQWSNEFRESCLGSGSSFSAVVLELQKLHPSFSEETICLLWTRSINLLVFSSELYGLGIPSSLILRSLEKYLESGTLAIRCERSTKSVEQRYLWESNSNWIPRTVGCYSTSVFSSSISTHVVRLSSNCFSQLNEVTRIVTVLWKTSNLMYQIIPPLLVCCVPKSLKNLQRRCGEIDSQRTSRLQ